MHRNMNVLFFDIDGTLALGLDVPVSAKEAIALTRRKGNLVFICTGRPLPYVKKHFSEYADGYICFNGRFAEVNDEIIYDVPLSDELLKQLIKRLDELKLGYDFSNNEGNYSGGIIEGKYQKPEYEDKILYNFNLHFKDYAQYDEACEKLKDLCIFNPHYPHLHADTTIIGSDKGQAIKAVTERLDIPFENTYAFGDGANDVCMLQAVAHGVAMGNGLQETKEAAEYVTADIDDDGIAKALAHYGLI